jgi:hypothetical protein
MIGMENGNGLNGWLGSIEVASCIEASSQKFYAGLFFFVRARNSSLRDSSPPNQPLRPQ